MSACDASRFLSTSTFGATATDVELLSRVGVERWLWEQRRAATTLHLPTLDGTDSPNARRNRISTWWLHSVSAPDQLRQRVAFALSQILVISDQQRQLSGNARAVAGYYDVLLRGAFGNYRDLLVQVTASPAMATYLSLRGSEKAGSTGGRPDENYARELMQLFTIGLVELNIDGTVKQGPDGPIPTYSQEVVEDTARALTGWSWSDSDFAASVGSWTAPMSSYAQYHDTGEKRLVRGIRIAPGGSAQTDLMAVIDALFNHPNVGPFIGKQLIQRLTSSNPSPSYVARVASAFNDTNGVRGDLWATVRAVLTDPEALGGTRVEPAYGKLREPLLVYTHLWRAFGGVGNGGVFPFTQPEAVVGQAPLSATSVFNFYRPDFSPAAIGDTGAVAPEAQILTEFTAVETSNDLYQSVYNRTVQADPAPTRTVLLDLADLQAIADRPADVVAKLDLVMTGCQMDGDTRRALEAAMGAQGSATPQQRLRAVQDALFLTLASADYQVQR